MSSKNQTPEIVAFTATGFGQEPCAVEPIGKDTFQIVSSQLPHRVGQRVKLLPGVGRSEGRVIFQGHVSGAAVAMEAKLHTAKPVAMTLRQPVNGQWVPVTTRMKAKAKPPVKLAPASKQLLQAIETFAEERHTQPQLRAGRIEAAQRKGLPHCEVCGRAIERDEAVTWLASDAALGPGCARRFARWQQDEAERVASDNGQKPRRIFSASAEAAKKAARLEQLAAAREAKARKAKQHQRKQRKATAPAPVVHAYADDETALATQHKVWAELVKANMAEIQALRAELRAAKPAKAKRSKPAAASERDYGWEVVPAKPSAPAVKRGVKSARAKGSKKGGR